MAVDVNGSLSKFEERSVPQASQLQSFLVLELMRYYPEPNFRRRFSLDGGNFWDAFDITLSDRHHRRKFVMTADAGLKQRITSGCSVRLKKFVRHWDETSVDGESVIVIQELEVVDDRPVDITKLHDVPWTPEQYSKQKENVPLASNRCYYVDNLTFSVATERVSDDGVQRCDIGTIDMAEVCCIRDVMTKKISQYASPTLLVKVMRKSRLIHYVTHSRDDKWPFQLPLMVADGSGWCPAVLWNKLAFQFYQQVHEGSLLLLKNFRVKNSMQSKLKSYFNPPRDERVFDQELSLDIHHPVSSLKLVDVKDSDDLDSLGFPPLEVCLMTRKDLLAVPDFSVVDVAGHVTFVGRVEREPKKGKGIGPQDSGAFFYKRWVHLRDSSLDDPIIILIYGGEQKELFMSLKPGQYLVCRHMLANQHLSELHSSRQRRHGWLTTTTNSWLYKVNLSNTRNLSDPLCDIVEAALPDQTTHHRNAYREGGFFRYPPFPYTLESLKKFDAGLLERVVPSVEWKSMFGNMTWKECHQLVVHSTLLSVTYEKLDGGKRSPLRHPPRKRRHTDEQNEDSSHLGLSRLQDIIQLWPSKPTRNWTESRSALIIKWQGLSEPVTLTTIKPCAFCKSAKVDKFAELVSGVYDSDFGLLNRDKPDLTKQEVKALTDSAHRLINSRFVLLLDVYTTEDNQQLITLNRAYHS